MRFKHAVLHAAVVAALQVPIAADAAGLGRLTVQSALGQPLRAEIELLNASRDEINQLVARLAPFSNARNALADPVPLPRDLRITIEQRAGGRTVVALRTYSTINDPYLVLPIELSGNDAGLVREFTLLFDPIDDRRAVEPPVVASAPVASARAAAPAPRTYEPTDREIAVPAPAAAAPAPRAAAAAPAPAPRAAATGDGSVYRVSPGDTLGRIAAATRAPGVSVAAASDAIFRDNPNAFIANNPDRLIAGAELVLPQGFEPRAVAVERSQPTRAEGGAPAPRARASGGGGDTLTLAPERLRGVDRIVIAEDRVAELEKSLEALEQLVAKQAQRLSALQELKAASGATGPGETAAPGSASAPAPAAGGQATPTPAAPAPASATVTPRVTAPAATTAEVSDSWWRGLDGIRDMLVGAVVAALGVLAIMRLRARKKNDDPGVTAAPESIDPFASDDEASVAPRKPVVSSAAMGPASLELPAATIQTTVGSGATDSTFDGSAIDAGEQVDPIAEAEVYLAYGRSAQAEEVLKDALERDPSNEAVALRLLEIYADRGDVEAFHSTAKIVKILSRETGESWAKVTQLRAQLETTVRSLLEPAPTGSGLELVDETQPANDDRATRDSKFG